MNDDPFRDWLVDEITALRNSHVHYRGKLTYVAAMKVDGGLKEAVYVLARYDALKAAAATDDAGTANHADAAETARTDDPDDQAVYEAAMGEYRAEIKRVLANELPPHLGDINQVWLTGVARIIAALPTPVKGGG